MLFSMTGYGKAEYLFADHKTIVEIRSVNSKQLDLNLKTAPVFRDREPEIRAMLQKPLERGKVDVTVYTQSLADNANQQGYTPINWDAVGYYVQDYLAHAEALRLPIGHHQSQIPNEVMATLLRYPDVLRQGTTEQVLTDEEWTMLQAAVQQALDGFLAFRQQEGLSLQNMFTDKLDGIAALLAEVEPFEKNRVENIRQRLMANLDKLAEETKQAIDNNRLEAEMIYYLEKLDITEEKVRLTNHIRYFRETMQETGAGVGKKLGFVAQEMGREINTLGSKSNQSEMQIIVVKMKDILEQIKEQVLNVL